MNILHRLLSKQNVPDLLNSPADPVAVGKVGVGSPVEDAFVVLARAGADAVAGQDKLAAAQVANSFGNLVHWHLQQMRVQLEEGVVDIGVLVVDGLPVDRNKGVGAARDASAAQVDEPVGVDRVVAEETQSGAGLGTKQLVVPLVVVGVDKDVVGREGVVILDDVGQIGSGLVALGGGGDEQALFGVRLHAVHKRCASTRCKK